MKQIFILRLLLPCSVVSKLPQPNESTNYDFANRPNKCVCWGDKLHKSHVDKINFLHKKNKATLLINKIST